MSEKKEIEIIFDLISKGQTTLFELDLKTQLGLGDYRGSAEYKASHDVLMKCYRIMIKHCQEELKEDLFLF